MNKRNAYGIAISILVLAVAVGCASMAAEAPAFDAAEGAPAQGNSKAIVESVFEDETAVSGSGGGEYATIERLIVRSAFLDLVVPDTREALDTITELTDGLGGYIVEASTHTYQEGLRASVTLRIPAEELDGALDVIRGLATEIRRENVSGQDVTEEYVDLGSRLRNLENTEAKLQEFLDEAEDTEAAMAVFERLTQVNAEIEQVKGRMDYLEESAAMSLVSVELTPDELAQPIAVGGWRPAGTLRSSIQGLIRTMQGLVDAAIVIVVRVIPVLLVLAIPVVVIVLLIRAIRRRRRARKASKAAEAAEAGNGDGGAVGEAGE